jgi:hypothetical protein
MTHRLVECGQTDVLRMRSVPWDVECRWSSTFLVYCLGIAANNSRIRRSNYRCRGFHVRTHLRKRERERERERERGFSEKNENERTKKWKTKKKKSEMNRAVSQCVREIWRVTIGNIFSRTQRHGPHTTSRQITLVTHEY